MSSDHADLLGQAIVEYASTGKYLDADLSLPIGRQAVRDAYKTISETKLEAENEIRSISRNYSEHVDVWIKHADSLQKDIDSSKALGTTITEIAKDTVEIDKDLDDACAHAEFLRKEINYNDILLTAIKNINAIKEDIDNAERKAEEKETMAAIKLLSEALRSIHSLPNYHRVRAYTLLEQRALRLETTLLDDLDDQWQSLVRIDIEDHRLSITKQEQNLPMTLRKTLVALRSLDQLDQKAKDFDKQIQAAIFQPRVLPSLRPPYPRIIVEENALHITEETTNPKVEDLLSDLAQAFTLIVDFIPEFSKFMSENSLPSLCVQIKDNWLEPLIPVDIDQMDPLILGVESVKHFTNKLSAIGWNQTDVLKDWIDDCARLWITKRKETDLVYVREHLARGLTNKRTIVKQQDTQIASSSDPPVDEDAWDQGWSDDEGESAVATSSPNSKELRVAAQPTDEKAEDGDAWGWNDVDGIEDDPVTPSQPIVITMRSAKPTQRPKTDTVTLKWKYLVSTMPEGVLDVLRKTIEDGLSLTQPLHSKNPAAPAAMAMFGLPTLILAMYRTASPYYYSMTEAGNMYLYNDALWLSEQLDTISKGWSSRPDVTPRLAGKVKYDKEVQTLELLGKRAYAKEISTQRTIIRDMLRGDQCFLSDEGVHIEEDEDAIDIVIAHIRSISKLWDTILARQNWAQAVGALLATVANKIITDILEISGLEADASYNIAKLIARVVALEDLYSAPTTGAEISEFAGLEMQASECVGSVWFKLQYLSEILQSNLDSLRFLWFEGEASMFYSASEMIDLIELSFAESSRREDITRKIRANPRPRPDL